MSNVNRLVNLIEKYHIPYESHTYLKNEFIYRLQDRCQSCQILLKGEILMSNLSIDGIEQVFNYFKAPNIFANNLIFTSTCTYISDVKAASDVLLLTITKESLLNAFHLHDDFLLCYLNIIADKTLEISQKLRIMAISNVDKRLLTYLKWKFKENGGIYLIKSVTALAAELSLPRETTSRAVSRLVQAGKIKYSNKCFKEIKNALDEL